MRNYLSTALFLAGFLALALPLTAQVPTRIGYIDTGRIIQQAPGASEAQATMEQERQGWERQMKAMDDSLRTMLTSYQQQQAMMTAEARQSRESEITAKRTSFEQRAEQLQEAALRRQQELMQPILARVEQAISEVRQAEGYAIVFDTASEAIVSADPALDLTAKVLERLQSNEPPAGN